MYISHEKDRNVKKGTVHITHEDKEGKINVANKDLTDGSVICITYRLHPSPSVDKAFGETEMSRFSLCFYSNVYVCCCFGDLFTLHFFFVSFPDYIFLPNHFKVLYWGFFCNFTYFYIIKIVCIYTLKSGGIMTFYITYTVERQQSYKPPIVRIKL